MKFIISRDELQQLVLNEAGRRYSACHPEWIGRKLKGSINIIYEPNGEGRDSVVRIEADIEADQEAQPC